MISKEQSVMLRKLLTGNILTGEFLYRLYFNKNKPRRNQSAKAVFWGLTTSIPTGIFCFCEKSHSREMRISFILHKERLLIPRQFTSQSGGSCCFTVNYLFSNKRESATSIKQAKHRPLGPIFL